MDESLEMQLAKMDVKLDYIKEAVDELKKTDECVETRLKCLENKYFYLIGIGTILGILISIVGAKNFIGW